MRLETILITPELAEMFLKNNHTNRRLRATHVDQFVRELQQGTFRTTHQGIAISKAGKLLDGQHRLSAIVKSGIAAMMVVAWECDVETALQWPVDFGLSRTTSDVMGIPHHEAAIYTVALHFINGNNRRCSTAELKGAEAALKPIVDKLLAMCPTCRRIFTRAPIRLAAMLRMANGSDYAGHQYAALVHGDYGSFSKASQGFHKHLAGLTGHTADMSEVPLAARAWCAFDEAKKDATRQQINDPFNQIDEMNAVLKSLGLKRQVAGTEK